MTCPFRLPRCCFSSRIVGFNLSTPTSGYIAAPKLPSPSKTTWEGGRHAAPAARRAEDSGDPLLSSYVMWYRWAPGHLVLGGPKSDRVFSRLTLQAVFEAWLSCHLSCSMSGEVSDFLLGWAQQSGGCRIMRIEKRRCCSSASKRRRKYSSPSRCGMWKVGIGKPQTIEMQTSRK